MNKQLKLLTDLCSIPTAPYVEQRVAAFVRAFVSKRSWLRLSQDKAGNLLVELPGSPVAPRWVFTAHMDHPGFIALRRQDDGLLEASFKGYIRKEYFIGAKVNFFNDAKTISGRIKDMGGALDRPDVPSVVWVKSPGDIPPGSIGMFDLGEGQIDGDIFQSRVCDDLAGAAACPVIFDELIKNPPIHTVAVLLTRAEEEGFIGCIAACAQPELLHPTDRIIAIECSAEQPNAKQGDGCIIRVGDRTSIFNSALTYFLSSCAKTLGERDKSFRYQRALMPGGTCEATVYDAYGFTAASICVPLANYHNMDTKRRKLAPEKINLVDWRSMVKLFVQVASKGFDFEPGHGVLKKQLWERYARNAGALFHHAGS